MKETLSGFSTQNEYILTRPVEWPPDERRKENIRSTLILGTALIVSGAIAKNSFALFITGIEIAYFTACLSITAFSYSVHRFTRDQFTTYIGMSFLFIAVMNFFFIYAGKEFILDGNPLRPANIFFWVSTFWYQAFAFFILIRAKNVRFRPASVLTTYMIITLGLVLVYLAVPVLRTIDNPTILLAYGTANSIAFVFFYAYMLRWLMHHRAGFTSYFTNLLIAGMVASSVSAIAGAAHLCDPRIPLFISWFSKFVAAYLCFSAAVSYSLLDPYRNLFGTLSTRTIQLEKANNNFRAALAEREVLIREIHHRVKNNMQILLSMLSIQATQAQSDIIKQALQESKNRVFAMSSVHEKLYQYGDLSRIDLLDYLNGLVTELGYGVAGKHITYETNGVHVLALMDTAINCGLIVNELVTNCIKHAFPEGRAGSIRVRIGSPAKEEIRIEVMDDGIGIPADIDPNTTDSMGMTLITTLAKQLQGTFQYEGNTGTHAVLTIPAL